MNDNKIKLLKDTLRSVLNAFQEPGEDQTYIEKLAERKETVDAAEDMLRQFE